MAKLIFLASFVSHDPSEIIILKCGFTAQEDFLLIMLKTVVLLKMLWKL